MSGFFKIKRNAETRELMQRPNEFVLLTQIAYRAKRTYGPSIYDLTIGQALIGDYKSIGLTERKYRTAKKNLEKWGFATFKATNKGTIAKLINSKVFDTNPEAKDEQTAEQATSRRRASDEQATTNNNVKNVKNGNNSRPIPKDFQVTPEMTEWFLNQQFRNIQIESATDEFIDYWRGEGKNKKDWTATWRNGMRKMETWRENKRKADDAWKNF